MSMMTVQAAKMQHWADATLLAYLDDELPAGERAEVERHLAECEACAGQLARLRSAASGLSRALQEVDQEAPERDIGALTAEWTTRARRARARSALAKAAVLVLVAAGGSAAAVPGSPVRGWIARSLEAVADLFNRGRPPAEPTGAVEIRLTEPAPDATIRVRLVDGDRAGVWSDGARYRSGPGRIEVISPGPGEVRIELPRSARSARVEIDGRVLLVKEGADLRLLAPALDSSEAELLFRP